MLWLGVDGGQLVILVQSYNTIHNKTESNPLVRVIVADTKGRRRRRGLVH